MDDQRRPRSARCRPVVTCAVGSPRSPHGHDVATHEEIARRLAAFADLEFAGEYDGSVRYDPAPYFVPSDTLTLAVAAHLGIVDAQDLYGGVVPDAFVATKAITHPLVSRRARAPSGWSEDFPRRVAECVLDGFSTYSRKDALRAGKALLAQGAARVKVATGIAGTGQWVVRDTSQLEETLASIGDEVTESAGVVLEQNLADVVTLSVGHVRVGGIIATYCGTQQLTANNEGAEVYGGSDLFVVCGDFDALLAFDLPPDVRRAIVQARVYDDAARSCFPDFFASRRNYDVAQGTDAQGHRRSGVLEQSWRVGGASGAEIGALEAFRADSAVRAVHAIAREVYGARPALPDAATVYFCGVDPRVGALTKYTLVERHADS